MDDLSLQQSAEASTTNQAPVSDPLSPKKVFSRIGLAFFAMLVVNVVSYLLVELLMSRCFPALLDHPWGALLPEAISIYLLGTLTCYLILRPLPSANLPRKSIKIHHLLLFFLAINFMVFVGNLASSFFTEILKKLLPLPVENPVSDAFSGRSLLPLVVSTVLLTPIVEELIFRKFVIDRIAKYGEGIAVIVSASIFAIAHGNFYQIFYAFGGGLIFGYLYLRTGKLRYSIILHMLVNFLGGVVSSVVYTMVPEEAWNSTSFEALLEPGILEPLLIMLAYSIFEWITYVAGLVVLCVCAKKLVWKPAPYELQKYRRGKVIFLNFGMIAFLVLYLAEIIFSLF